MSQEKDDFYQGLEIKASGGGAVVNSVYLGNSAWCAKQIKLMEKYGEIVFDSR
ncbi:MAG: hypothetical protein GY702_03550 [Desulfobulbaceae bacterium]|nr:hypothetical protein [Desulfobulbaceae bacterium]